MWFSLETFGILSVSTPDAFTVTYRKRANGSRSSLRKLAENIRGKTQTGPAQHVVKSNEKHKNCEHLTTFNRRGQKIYIFRTLLKALQISSSDLEMGETKVKSGSKLMYRCYRYFGILKPHSSVTNAFNPIQFLHSLSIYYELEHISK